MNPAHTSTLLLAGLTVLLSLVAALAFGAIGIICGPVALVATLLLQGGDRAFAPRGAVQVNPSSRLGRVFAAIADRAGIRRARLFVAPTPVLNAFASGGAQSGAVVLTEPLLQRFSEAEVAGILAHEVSHLAHDDTRMLRAAYSIAAMVLQVGVISALVALFGFLLDADATRIPAFAGAVGACVLAVWMAPQLSRLREFAADQGAAELLGAPEPLMRALARLDGYQRRFTLPWRREQGHWADSHPHTSVRIGRLRGHHRTMHHRRLGA